MFDMMRYQFGEVASIDARLGGANDFSMLVEFQSGMYATFVTSADASWFFPYERLEIFGEYSTIETQEMDFAALSHRPRCAYADGRLPGRASGNQAGVRGGRPAVCGCGFGERRTAGDGAGWAALGGAGVCVLSEHAGEAAGGVGVILAANARESTRIG